MPSESPQCEASACGWDDCEWTGRLVCIKKCIGKTVNVGDENDPREKRTDDIPSWDVEFLKIDQGMLFELILVR